jgi:NAD(P)-dependent dehydrogenase (short-subunit alcohol dehydrogenase family)
MALELAPHGINVNAIAPGIIETAMTSEDLSIPEVREEALAMLPLKKIGTPEDVARVAAFLASGDADYLSGSVITVDGGYTLQ